MDVIVSRWCMEQRKRYFGLTCDRCTLCNGTALLVLWMAVQKDGHDLFSTIYFLKCIQSFNLSYLRMNEIMCSWRTNFSFYCLFYSLFFTAHQHTCNTEHCTSYSNSVRLSERLSVTRGYCVNSTPATIMQSSLEDSCTTLVSWWLTSPRNSEGNIGQGY